MCLEKQPLIRTLTSLSMLLMLYSCLAEQNFLKENPRITAVSFSVEKCRNLHGVYPLEAALTLLLIRRQECSLQLRALEIELLQLELQPSLIQAQKPKT